MKPLNQLRFLNIMALVCLIFLASVFLYVLLYPVLAVGVDVFIMFCTLFGIVFIALITDIIIKE